MNESASRSSPSLTDTQNADQASDNNQPATRWKFNQEDVNASQYEIAAKTTPVKSSSQPVSWAASEFIHHEKPFSWYVRLGLITIVITGIIFLLTHDTISSGFIVFAALIFGFYAARKPRVLNYKLDGTGLSIGQKFYSYGNFKSFALINEGALSSIILMPLKRFMPSMTIYFEPKDEAKITDTLATHLPVEIHKLDAVDNLMRRIRF